MTRKFKFQYEGFIAATLRELKHLHVFKGVLLALEHLRTSSVIYRLIEICLPINYPLMVQLL